MTTPRLLTAEHNTTLSVGLLSNLFNKLKTIFVWMMALIFIPRKRRSPTSVKKLLFPRPGFPTGTFTIKLTFSSFQINLKSCTFLLLLTRNNEMPTTNGNNNKVTQENLESREEDEVCSSPSKRVKIGELKINDSNSDSDTEDTLQERGAQHLDDVVKSLSSEDTPKVSTSVLRLTLGNYNIMENICKFLDNHHLDLWCKACKSFKLLNCEDMDSCCWELRAMKHAVAYEQSLIPLEDAFPGKTFREIFFIVKEDVDRLVIETREWLDDHVGDDYAVPSAAQIALASSLCYYGFLGPDPTELYPIEVLQLCNVDLSPYPLCSKQLDSLINSVYRRLVIENVSGCDLVSILDNIQCPITLCLHREEKLDTEETSALVRAMESHVEKVLLGHDKRTELDIKTLTQYSGRGQCNVLHIVENDDGKEEYAEEMKNWARDKNWSWEADGDNRDTPIILYMFERV